MKTEITPSMLNAALRLVKKCDREFTAFDRRGRVAGESRAEHDARWNLLRLRWHNADVACDKLQRARYNQIETFNA